MVKTHPENRLIGYARVSTVGQTLRPVRHRQAHRGRESAVPIPLAEPWADTGTSTGRLMLAVLGGLADVERDLIRTRTAEGRSRTKAQGKAMGRPPSLTPAQQKEATRRRAQGATLQELADSYDRSIATMRRATLAAA
jgi:DNA invertase Pin-like site-specific DNA recombinase